MIKNPDNYFAKIIRSNDWNKIISADNFGSHFFITLYPDQKGTGLEITSFIKELLYDHDCVIIPGFGGFIGNYTPAQIDRTTGTFFPPVKQISFNRNLNHNDGLLVGKISASSGINYGDARNIVGEYAEELQKRLLKGERIVFEGIGTFLNNHEGNIQFEPDHDSNFLLNAFGLTSFRMKPLAGLDSDRKILRHEGRESSGRSSIGRYLWRAAVIIPIVGALIAVPLTTDLFRTKVQSTTLNPLASVEFEKNREAIDSSMDESLPVDSAQFNAPVEPEVKPETQVVSETQAIEPVPEAVYHVIAGSFQSEVNAGIMMRKLAEDGYIPELVKAPNGFYRVCAVKCTTLDEAVEKRDSIKTIYSGTWVTRIK